MKVWKYIASQFGNPRGLLGRLAGYIMATRASNIERSEWGIELLNIQPADNVLEIGFGPGIAIQKMSALVDEGTIYGIDHSELMCRQAMAVNAEAIERGKVKLYNTSVAALPRFETSIDKVLDVNSFHFWEQPVESLTAVRSLMREGGVIALVYQPRIPGATDADAEQAGETFSACLRDAGFGDITVERTPMKPVSVICVLARNFAT
jgi:SAM-dependent methyltransferase